MLVPFRLKEPQELVGLAAALDQFRGEIVWPPDTSVENVQDRVLAERDPDRDLWIAVQGERSPFV